MNHWWLGQFSMQMGAELCNMKLAKQHTQQFNKFIFILNNLKNVQLSTKINIKTSIKKKMPDCTKQKESNNTAELPKKKATNKVDIYNRQVS